jgi:hypothetical protein
MPRPPAPDLEHLADLLTRRPELATLTCVGVVLAEMAAA